MKSHRLAAVPALLVACLGAAAFTPPAQAQTTVPLVTFYSPARGDFFTTSQPAWTCKIHNSCATALPLDYRLVGLQGHVFNPALPKPIGTLTLWHWYSDVRGDNFLTTDPAWNPSLGTTRPHGGANYVFVRVAGYLNQAGANPHLSLVSYWNAAVADNAAMAELVGATGSTIRRRAPTSYARYRVEGTMVPPSTYALGRCTSAATPKYTDSPTWLARGNYIDRWSKPNGFYDGDTIKVTSPGSQSYRIDYWGATKPVRGVFGDRAPIGSAFPAPGILRYALMGRVTSGRVYVADQGWFEAYEWFRALGEYTGSQGACVLYDAKGTVPGSMQVGFNDDNISDNGGGATVAVQQWY